MLVLPWQKCAMRWQEHVPRTVTAAEPPDAGACHALPRSAAPPAPPRCVPAHCGAPSAGEAVLVEGAPAASSAGCGCDGARLSSSRTLMTPACAPCMTCKKENESEMPTWLQWMRHELLHGPCQPQHIRLWESL